MKNWKEYRNKKLTDPAVIAELEIEEMVRYEIIQLRKELGFSQTVFSNVTEIAQADISKLENGKITPSLATLKKNAKALGKKLVIQFV